MKAKSKTKLVSQRHDRPRIAASEITNEVKQVCKQKYYYKYLNTISNTPTGIPNPNV